MGHEENAYTVPFVEGASYDPDVPEPGAFLGYPFGTRPATYDETTAYFKELSKRSERVSLKAYGDTHEGRKLYYLVVSSAENMTKIQATKTALRKLADPRTLDIPLEADTIIQNTPAIAWMAYSIHGGELSSTDAAIWLAYQLLAGKDPATRAILNNTIVVIDPIQNPDGRERFLAQIRSFSGKAPNPDVQSAQHQGFWPGGRGNHYLFDLNRDFFILSQPETRARVRAFQEWMPQLFVDSHEMGALDTYLFSPPREPLNPNLTAVHHKWASIFARDQAKAFDGHGWSYYTREWLDMWYPGYTEWIAYAGAIMILYEQAGVQGSLVRRREGTTMTYRETVHHHITSSLANLTTLAKQRKAMLTDYYEEKKRAIAGPTGNGIHAYLIESGTNVSRSRSLIENLLFQGFEIHRAEASFTAKGITTSFGERLNEKPFPKGTWIIPTAQPLNLLINAVLEFDPRMKDSFLAEERFDLEKKNESRLYDVSSWSMPIAYGAVTCQATEAVSVPMRRVHSIEYGATKTLPSAKYGYVLTGDSDASVQAVIELLNQGCIVRVSEKDFQVAGKAFSKGSFLLRIHENAEDLKACLSRIIQKTHAEVLPADTALSLESIDLGGQHFLLLAKPRIGLFMGRTVGTTSFGALWNYLDSQCRTRISTLDIDRITSLDLRNYNVLILPSGYLRGSIRESGLNRLKLWIEGGGTLIAVGSSVGMLTDPKTGLSSVRERSQILSKLDVYEEAVKREEEALTATASQADIWDYSPPQIESATKPVKKKDSDEEKLKRDDSWKRRFSPKGAFLRARTDRDHWLAFGLSSPMAVMVRSSNAYFALPPVQVPVRLVDEKTLRVSGLVWPEARQRFAQSCYLTRESKGKGQIILFPFEPCERAYYPETTRLLWNAIFLGPGAGTSQPIPW